MISLLLSLTRRVRSLIHSEPPHEVVEEKHSSLRLVNSPSSMRLVAKGGKASFRFNK